MKKRGKSLAVLIIAVVISAAVLLVWRITGGDYYTKFEVIRQQEIAVAADDPLAGTGFYEDEKNMQTVREKDFRLGLLPSPGSLLDKHMLSVVTVIFPLWIIAAIMIWQDRKQGKIQKGPDRS